MPRRPPPSMVGQVYSLTRPPGEDFWRAATCEETRCSGWVNGWVTVLPSDDGRCAYIRRGSGRAFTEDTAAGLTTFRFEPGQRCFRAADHRKQVEREPLYRVGGTTRRQHARPELWVEDFSEHLDKVNTARNRG